MRTRTLGRTPPGRTLIAFCTAGLEAAPRPALVGWIKARSKKFANIAANTINNLAPVSECLWWYVAGLDLDPGPVSAPERNRRWRWNSRTRFARVHQGRHDIERIAAGEINVFPQEITRPLLNLISNGFYAGTKRKEHANSGGYEPTLTAATKNLGDKVEIRIRDNGTGIPSEVREKMFNPFFTTKPAGEGTGLGLSITHDIVVKQHSGSIEVDTQPGEFTEVRIVLPRAAAFIAGKRA
jgi:signal transduction histidine kinase